MNLKKIIIFTAFIFFTPLTFCSDAQNAAEKFNIFISAIKAHDFESAENLLEQGFDLNACGDAGFAPMHIVAMLNNLEAVRFLADHGANLDIQSVVHTKSMPLHMVALWGRLPMVQLLLELGADVNGLNNDHQTPLHLFIVKVVTTAYKSISLEDFMESHAGRDHRNVVESLMQAGADPYVKSVSDTCAIDIVDLFQDHLHKDLVDGNCDVATTENFIEIANKLQYALQSNCN